MPVISLIDVPILGSYGSYFTGPKSSVETVNLSTFWNHFNETKKEKVLFLYDEKKTPIKLF